MAFADYLDLRTAVVEEIGDPGIVDKFDRLTKLAEARLNRKLRTVDQIKETTVTFTAGVAALPSDFLDPIGLYDASGYEYVFQAPQMTKPTGLRTFVSVQGSNLVTQGADGTRTLAYYASLPTLTASMTTTNWLLQKYPSVYLYAVQYEAEKAARRVNEAGILKGVLDAELDEVAREDSAHRYARARVRVAGVTP